MSEPASEAPILASLSDVGREREENQDSCGIFEDAKGRRLLLVADGMGGHRGGQQASQLAVAAIGEYLRGRAEEAPLELLRGAVSEANRRIREEAARNPELTGMGTTAVLLLLDAAAEAWVGHVGDSRAYRLSRGSLEELTRDHSVRRLLIDGGMPPEDADRHPDAHALTRALGAEDDVEVEVARVSLLPGDVFLLCSDGLWGLVDAAQIRKLLSSLEPDVCVEALVDAANRQGGRDNITVQIARIPGAASPMPIERAGETDSDSPTAPQLILPAELLASAELARNRIESAPTSKPAGGRRVLWLVIAAAALTALLLLLL